MINCLCSKYKHLNIEVGIHQRMLLKVVSLHYFWLEWDCLQRKIYEDVFNR